MKAEKTIRELAIKWYDSMTIKERHRIYKKHLPKSFDVVVSNEVLDQLYLAEHPTPVKETVETVILNFLELLQSHKELADSLEMMLKTCEPENVKYIPDGYTEKQKYYVGSCGIPSGESIHKAINALANAKKLQ